MPAVVGKTSTPEPKPDATGSAQTYKKHGGGKGVIGILEIIVENIQESIQGDVDLENASIANFTTRVETLTEAIQTLKRAKTG
jgi:hypothetical protein